MIIDCVGLPCPKPVIATKKAVETIKENETICVVVDNEIATENLSKFCEQMKCKFKIDKESDSKFFFYLTKGETIEEVDMSIKTMSGITVVVDSDIMGSDENIGSRLIEMYFYTLTESKEIPSTIIFYNEGVKLSSINDKVIEDLKKLVSRGVKVLSCGACLDFFKLDLKVGEVTNMMVISDTMMSSEKVIKI
ncbi:MAG: sulfurtransferase-like selenium metabolism protein YedF [Lachnospirales bacterium]